VRPFAGKPQIINISSRLAAYHRLYYLCIAGNASLHWQAEHAPRKLSARNTNGSSVLTLKHLPGEEGDWAIDINVHSHAFVAGCDRVSTESVQSPFFMPSLCASGFPT
jgi:hypothetical protein